MIHDPGGVSRFVRGLIEEHKETSAQGAPFVTISREAGAGGRTLAEAILKAMSKRPEHRLWKGWQIFDRELCEAVMKDPRIRVSLEALMSEKERGDFEDMLASFFGGESPQARVDHAIFKTVHEVASVGRAIIVGRGAACCTRHLELGVRVRLVAPRELRVKRVAHRRSVSEHEAKQWVAEQDDHRARLVHRCFHKDINDPLLYDAIFNTDTLEMSSIAEAVLTLIERRVAEAGTSA